MPAVEDRILEVLRKYFGQRDDVAFALLFGSSARGKIRKEGDIDVAVYFWPEKGVEWENVRKRYAGESRIALDLERLLKKEIDLIVLNRAKAILADEAIRKGKPIVVKAKGLGLVLCIGSWPSRLLFLESIPTLRYFGISLIVLGILLSSLAKG